MLCVVKGITSLSIKGVEYKVEDGMVEVPDEEYVKIANHPGVRPATSIEIEELEKAIEENRIADEKARLEAEEKAKLEAEKKAKKEVEAAKKVAEAKEVETGAGNASK